MWEGKFAAELVTDLVVKSKEKAEILNASFGLYWKKILHFPSFCGQ